MQEGVKLIVVLVQNHGFASIGALSETVGAQRFGTATGTATRPPAGWTATSCRSTWPRTRRASGVRVLRAQTIAELRAALRQAKDEAGPVLVHIETDPMIPAPDSEAWWDVPVAEVAELESTRRARAAYERPSPLSGPLSARRRRPPVLGTMTGSDCPPGRGRRGLPAGGRVTGPGGRPQSALDRLVVKA